MANSNAGPLFLAHLAGLKMLSFSTYIKLSILYETKITNQCTQKSPVILPRHMTAGQEKTV